MSKLSFYIKKPTALKTFQIHFESLEGAYTYSACLSVYLMQPGRVSQTRMGDSPMTIPIVKGTYY